MQEELQGYQTTIAARQARINLSFKLTYTVPEPRLEQSK